MLVELAVRIPAGNGIVVDGDLAKPIGAGGLALFAHGSDSSRRSPRDRAVAAGLCDPGLGTLLLDLLTPNEEAVDARTRELRFDIGLLAGRLEAAAAWLADQPGTRDLEIGDFGASTGAAAALVAAARRPARIDRPCGWRSCPTPPTCSRSRAAPALTRTTVPWRPRRQPDASTTIRWSARDRFIPAEPAGSGVPRSWPSDLDRRRVRRSLKRGRVVRNQRRAATPKPQQCGPGAGTGVGQVESRCAEPRSAAGRGRRASAARRIARPSVIQTLETR
jgi:dienelactone hydrolase